MKTDTIHHSSKMRTTELRRDKGYIHILKYMGSKRELLPDIKNCIRHMIPEGGTVVDLFAGTVSVGAYLKDDYNIISNDIQTYSMVLAQALIESSTIPIQKDLEHTILEVKKKYQFNKTKLLSIFPDTYKKSNDFVKIKKGGWTEKLRKEYHEFFNSFPSSSNQFSTGSDELTILKDMYFKYSANNQRDIYFQTTFLFSETYFSFEQAIDIDSIRYAIDQVVDDKIIKSIFLTALIHAYSYCSSGTGHFAMFRDLKDVESIEDTFLYRKKNVWDHFIKKLNELIGYHQYIPHRKYMTYSENYSDLLKRDIMKNVDLVYADPPYSSVHYSRFYHAIESLIKYDYDIPRHKGRYRTDRHQSPFCQSTKTKQAFEELFDLTKKHQVQVLLSYSDTGMISKEEIEHIIKERGYQYKIQSISYDHSTLGRRGHKSNKINEYLIEATL